MADQAQELLKKGIAAAQAKQNDQARALLQQAVRLDPTNETTWLWLSSVARDNQERIFCLRQLLNISPNNEMAIKGLRALGVSVQKPEETSGGVPIPSDQALASAQPALDAILHEYNARSEPNLGFEWVAKTRGRAGERSSIYLSLGVAAAVVAVVGVILVVLAAVVVPQVQVLMGPTITPTPRPFTPTPTPTEGPTETPSPMPRVSLTPSSTYEPEVPDGADAFSRSRHLTATPVYYTTPHPAVADAVDAGRAYAEKRYDDAIALARRARANSPGQERALLDTFFYEAMSQAMKENYTQAVDVLRAALAIDNIALLNAGLGYVYYQMGRLQDSARYNQTAINQDNQLALPVLTQADVYLAFGQPGDALNLVESALKQPRLVYDVNLIVKRGEAHLEMGDYSSALADARLALYIDPLAESAHLLAARTDIARGEYGAAVLDLRDYLFYYPGSILGWTLLGEARYGEGNLNMALAAYAQALAADAGIREELTAHLSRGNLYLARELYPEAFADFDAALKIAENRRVRKSRAVAAFQTGRFEVAQEDAEAVLAVEPNNGEMRLLLGQALVMQEEYEQAQAALNAALGQNLTRSQQASAFEYLARAYYHEAEAQTPGARDLGPALDAINQALALEESGSRHYYRGLILELAGQPGLAKADYEWVLTWGDVYGYPFLVDASDRLEEVSALPTAAATPSPTPAPGR